MIDASQMRAARGLLEWSQTQLAEASGLSLPTIKRMEKVGPGRSSADNVKAIIDALQAAGVILIPENGEGRGVRLKKDRPD